MQTLHQILPGQLELKIKRSREICQKTTMDQVFETTFLVIFLCNLDGCSKVLKLLCGVWNEVIFKKRKIVQTTLSLVL